jgi:hypothetical protein
VGHTPEELRRLTQQGRENNRNLEIEARIRQQQFEQEQANQKKAEAEEILRRTLEEVDRQIEYAAKSGNSWAKVLFIGASRKRGVLEDLLGCMAPERYHGPPEWPLADQVIAYCRRNHGVRASVEFVTDYGYGGGGRISGRSDTPEKYEIKQWAVIARW